jgi:predicted dehydrogenase
MSDSELSISRKTFLKTSLLGLGAAAVPAAAWGCSAKAVSDDKYFQQWRAMEALPDEEKLNIALVGLGGYASGQLAPALQETKLCRLNGIVTGTPAKEDQWAQQYSIAQENMYNYDTFDQIADNDAIDAVYIVLPNSMHAEYGIRAAEAGKHVISEKPMTTSVADAQAMVDACNKAGTKLSIGYRLHFEPHHEEIMRLGQEQVFGPLKQIEGAHAFTINDPSRWRLDKELAGGGPLMDVGIYVIQASLYTTGTLPLSVTARSESGNEKLFSEVEETINWELQFPDGVTAKGMSSYAKGASYHRTEAQDGKFEISPAYSYDGLKGQVDGEALGYPQENQQAMQMDAFADHILNGAPNRVPGEMGVRDMKILYAIYEAAETGQKVEFDWADDVPVGLMGKGKI